MPIERGLMTRSIVLQRAPLTQSPSGELSRDWESNELIEQRLPAQWLPGDTREAYQAGQRLEATVSGIYRIDYVDEPKPEASRILGHDGRIYDVLPAVEIDFRVGWDVPVIARAET